MSTREFGVSPVRPAITEKERKTWLIVLTAIKSVLSAIRESGQKSRVLRRSRVCAFYRSLNNIYVQIIIDDTAGKTLVSASSVEPALRQKGAGGGRGRAGRQRAREKGHHRGRVRPWRLHYHGRIIALADGAREAGLKF